MLAIGALLASLASLGFGPPVLVDAGYPPLRLWPEQVREIQQLADPPTVSAVSAMVVDLDSGQTLVAKNVHAPLPPASTIKILTALVVLRHSNLNDYVTVSARAAATEGSRMGLEAGETLTVQDLLYGLLLPSGNDAAVALAEYVGGTEASFVSMMNDTARELGLAETRCIDPHGLDGTTQVTSASDLAKLSAAALAFPAFAQIVAQPAARVAGRDLVNTNELLETYPGADGVKTGTTTAAGECLVASVSQDGHRLLTVVLGSEDRYADVRVLLDFVAAGWRWKPVTLSDNALAWERAENGQHYRLRAADNGGILLPAWQWRLIQPLRVIDASVPLTGTLPVGRLRLMLDASVLAEVPLTVWSGP